MPNRRGFCPVACGGRRRRLARRRAGVLVGVAQWVIRLLQRGMHQLHWVLAHGR